MTDQKTQAAFENEFSAKWSGDFTEFNGTCYEDVFYKCSCCGYSINTDFGVFSKGYQAATAHILSVLDSPEMVTVALAGYDSIPRYKDPTKRECMSKALAAIIKVIG